MKPPHPLPELGWQPRNTGADAAASDPVDGCVSAAGRGSATSDRRPPESRSRDRMA